jgi:squalene-associated FAD-dependent desaturase
VPDHSTNQSVAVIGGGLAGLAAAAALGSVGYQVTVFEARPFLGGRATSYPLNVADDVGPTIDNCQHVLLRCCTNLLDFYRRLGVEDRIEFHRCFNWIEPGGRRSVMRSGILPAPLHFTGSFASLRFLSLESKMDVARAMLAVRREFNHRPDLDNMTMLDWLREKRQSEQTIARFWRQVLVSAINEELDRMAASHGLHVFATGFLSHKTAYEMGIPKVPLADLYSAATWRRIPSIEFRDRTPVEGITVEDGLVIRLQTRVGRHEPNACVCAVPFERVKALIPSLPLDLSEFSHSPITGIHLWFDRSVTQLPHATLLDRTIQWMFNKNGGRHIQVVVSASRSLIDLSRQEILKLAIEELQEFFPAVREAKLERAHVVKEVRATFSAAAGLEAKRPVSDTAISNFFLAGDWTRSGWPATMEGAVRSGYLAAEAVARYFGNPKKFLLPS